MGTDGRVVFKQTEKPSGEMNHPRPMSRAQPASSVGRPRARFESLTEGTNHISDEKGEFSTTLTSYNTHFSLPEPNLQRGGNLVGMQ